MGLVSGRLPAVWRLNNKLVEARGGLIPPPFNSHQATWGRRDQDVTTLCDHSREGSRCDHTLPWRESSWLAPTDMRTDAGVSHADHWQAAHHRHHGYLHHRHRGYHGYPPEADQQLVHPPPSLCVGVKGGLAKHTLFTTFFTPFPQSEIFQKNVVAVVIITTAILKSCSGSLLLWHYHHEGDFVIPVISNDLV